MKGSGLTPVEAAVGFAVLAGALAAVVPSCLRSIRISRTAEAVENVDRIALAAAHLLDEKHPLVAAPLTPSQVPRGTTAVDAPGTWEHPTWKALGFSLDEPHAYAYRVDVDVDAATPLRVVAQGDLDGDGVLSTFERGVERDAHGHHAPRAALVVVSELE